MSVSQRISTDEALPGRYAWEFRPACAPLAAVDSSPRTLGMLRVWVFGILFLKILPEGIHLIAVIPRERVHMPGLFAPFSDPLLDTIFAPDRLLLLKVCLLVGLAGMTLGARISGLALLTCLLLLVYQTLLRSFGFINHAELGLTYSAIVLAMFPCRDGFGMSSARQPARPQLYSAPILAIVIAVMFFYCAVGVHRLVHGPWSMYYTDSMKYWLLHRSYNPLDYPTTFGRWLAANDVWFRVYLLGFFATTLLEAFSPLCLISRRFLWVWLVGILGFHLLSPLIMAINFWENVLLLVVLCLCLKPWNELQPVPSHSGEEERAERNQP